MTANLLLSDRDGFTPHIARLVGMMAYTRLTAFQAVQGLSTEELDFLPEGFGNSVGMLLEHFAAVERIYQLISTGHPGPDGALEDCWWPGLNLGCRAARRSGAARWAITCVSCEKRARKPCDSSRRRTTAGWTNPCRCEGRPATGISCGFTSLRTN